MAIKDIIELAKGLDSQRDDFASTSLEKLRNFNINKDLNSFNKDLSQWILSNKLCDQLNVYNNFGQPPVTLFNNGSFVIDLYFWLHSDTSIHTHSFKGAFKVLFGESQQEVFEINKQRDFLGDIRFNHFKVVKREILKTSDCQMITQGDDFCHRVTHLDSPTVTLCIRTINNREIPQWHQFENGLSILKVEVPQETYKAIFFLQYLMGQNIKTARAFINKLIENSSASLIMNLFEEALCGGLGLEDEVLELLQEAVLQKYQEEEWFKLYLEACS